MLTLQGRVTWDQDGVLPSTTADEAQLIAVREALRAVPEDTSPAIVTGSDLAHRLIEGRQRPRQPELIQTLREIRDLLRLRRLRLQMFHTEAGTMHHLRRAQALAELAAARARQSVNCPACPRCGDRTLLKHVTAGRFRGSRIWGCVNFPNCKGFIPLYQAKD
ncbi:hypothetical protein [Deinococcus multiflagellatus]|uniref:DNA topoisomerase type IA zn finger domain-containing protein n=1 Tax=Deinococcus multiflagellatus TaxID=1656887 RepID=A0ABW1ZNS0_9DEIO|nr:hypothetical protein [Deinococcus multiflagellatus]MBZ9714902.1 hypothetical protein [Deinococcus multiflagellatus]